MQKKQKINIFIKFIQNASFSYNYFQKMFSSKKILPTYIIMF